MNPNSNSGRRMAIRRWSFRRHDPVWSHGVGGMRLRSRCGSPLWREKPQRFRSPKGFATSAANARNWFSLSVCGSCRDNLDKEWENVAATEWVLVTTAGPDTFNRHISKGLVARGKPPRPDGLYRYIFRNTTYRQMKSHWAACNSSVLMAGPATSEDIAQMRLVSARSKRPDSPASHEHIAVGTFGGWPLSRLAFIRPASHEEIAEHDAMQRWYKDVYDAALLKLPADERHAFALKLSSGRTHHDEILWDRWETAVREAVEETKCPFHIHPIRWRLPGHRFFPSK